VQMSKWCAYRSLILYCQQQKRVFVCFFIVFFK
jgi:hypothetical protein